MIGRADFKEDPTWIAGQLLPAIRPEQAQDALDLLLELALVERDEEGKLTRGAPSITTGHEVRSLAVANYHRQMLHRAADSIALVKSEMRDISALTVCIREQTVAELKERIHGFREHLIDRCDRDEDANSVYQVNIQLFPLTQIEKDEP